MKRKLLRRLAQVLFWATLTAAAVFVFANEHAFMTGGAN